MTANAMQEDELKSMEAGCDVHLTKPVRKKALMGVIDDVISGLAAEDSG
ncbi:hypothetical protein ACQZV8_16630 [Magnetococcales bacterium HHB-1]